MLVGNRASLADKDELDFQRNPKSRRGSVPLVDRVGSKQSIECGVNGDDVDEGFCFVSLVLGIEVWRRKWN